MDLPAFQVCDDDLSQEVLTAYLGESFLAVDTETMGLLPHRDRLCTVQFCDVAGQAVLLRIRPGTTKTPRLRQLLESPSTEKVFHYARFDVAMLSHHLGIRTWPLFCTKVASKLARTYTGKHGLKDLVRELCGVDLNKEAQSSDWGSAQELSPAQLEYAINDVRHLLAARDRLEAMLRREGRWELAQRCFAHLPTLVELDLLGYANLFEHQ